MVSPTAGASKPIKTRLLSNEGVHGYSQLPPQGKQDLTETQLSRRSDKHLSLPWLLIGASLAAR